MDNKFLSFLSRIVKNKWVIAIGSITTIGALVATTIFIKMHFNLWREHVVLDEHGLPVVSEEEKAAIEKAREALKVKRDVEAKSTDSRFFTFNSGLEFINYIKKLMPELIPRFDSSDNETDLAWIAALGKITGYFIEFKGLLNNDLHNSDDYAILLKGEPYSDSSFKVVVSNQILDANDVYDVDTKYKDVSFDAKGDSSLHERFGITNNDLSHASHIIFLQKPTTGSATITFSKVAEYAPGKFGILEEQQITRSNIKKIKEVTSNPKLDFFLKDNTSFQIVKFACQGTWV